MKRFSLRIWVTLTILLPTLLFGILFGGYLVLVRLAESKDLEVMQARSFTEPMAVASQRALLLEDRATLKMLVSDLHRQNSPFIEAIAVFDRDNRPFVSSNHLRNIRQLQIPAGQSIPMDTQLVESANYLVVLTPILADEQLLPPGLAVDDFHQRLLGYIAVKVNTTPYQLKLYQSFLVLLAFLLLVVLASTLLARTMMRKVTDPVVELSKAVGRIREGHLDTRIRNSMPGEMDTLRHGINAMAKSLQDYHNEMQQSIDQATLDLRETLEQFEIQNVELDLANRRAQEANRVKGEFLANMSHELRTPLNGVIGFTRQLLKTDMTAHQADYLRTIEQSAGNLLSIINDILDFSKLEAGKLLLERVPFDLRDLAEEVLTLLGDAAHKKGLELNLQLYSDVPTDLIGDSLRIRQILTNLVGNAIKFTDSGSVLVRIMLEDETREGLLLRINVSDTGIGISDEQQARLFKPFAQAESSISRRYGGTGLGLVITERLIYEMKGDLSLESAVGQGSTFSFTLLLEPNPNPIHKHHVQRALMGQRLAFFEPHKETRLAVMNLLRDWETRVEGCASPDDWPNLLRRAGDQRPMVLIGFNAANQDIQLLQDLITQSRPVAQRLVVLLSSADPKLMQRICEWGADECLSKPFRSHRLYETLCSEMPSLPAQARGLDREAIHRLSHLRVMAVDDNLANLKLLETLLSDVGIQVASCSSGQQAVELARNEPFDLIFMDLQMPIMDGLTASGMIRETTLNSNTPIVAVTAHALAEEKQQLLRQGLNDYLAKPLDEAMLLQIIQKWTGEHTEPPVQLSLPAHNVGGSLDWSLALKQVGGNESLAREMLSMLLESLPEHTRELANARKEGNREGILHHVHKLNGASCYTGATRLRAVATRLEEQLKRGVELNQLEGSLDELGDELSRVEREGEELMVSHP